MLGGMDRQLPWPCPLHPPPPPHPPGVPSPRCPAGSFFLPWLAFAGVSAAYAAVAALGVSLIAPAAAGSGIPQMRVCRGGGHSHTMCRHCAEAWCDTQLAATFWPLLSVPHPGTFCICRALYRSTGLLVPAAAALAAGLAEWRGGR